MAHVLGVNRAYLAANPMRVLTESEETLKDYMLVTRRPRPARGLPAGQARVLQPRIRRGALTSSSRGPRPRRWWRRRVPGPSRTSVAHAAPRALIWAPATARNRRQPRLSARTWRSPPAMPRRGAAIARANAEATAPGATIASSCLVRWYRAARRAALRPDRRQPALCRRAGSPPRQGGPALRAARRAHRRQPRRPRLDPRDRRGRLRPSERARLAPLRARLRPGAAGGGAAQGRGIPRRVSIPDLAGIARVAGGKIS